MFQCEINEFSLELLAITRIPGNLQDSNFQKIFWKHYDDLRSSPPRVPLVVVVVVVVVVAAGIRE